MIIFLIINCKITILVKRNFVLATLARKKINISCGMAGNNDETYHFAFDHLHRKPNVICRKNNMIIAVLVHRILTFLQVHILRLRYGICWSTANHIAFVMLVITIQGRKRNSFVAWY